MSKPTKRRLVDPKESYRYTPKMEVHARPTDPYVRPAEDNDARMLVDSLDKFRQIGVQYVDLQESKRNENMKRGKADAIRERNGEAVDPKPKSIFNLNLGYDEGYHFQQGQGRGVDFKVAVADELKNVHRNFEHLAGMVDEETGKDAAEAATEKWLEEKYMEFFGESNEYEVLGAESYIQEARLGARLAIQKHHDELKSEATLTSHAKVLVDDIKGNITDTKAMRKAFSLHRGVILTENPGTDKDAITRSFLRAVRQSGFDLIEGGEDPVEVQEQIQALTELMSTPDESGFSWSTALNADGTLKFEGDIEGILSDWGRLLEDSEKTATKEATEESNALYRTLDQRIFLAKNMEDLEEVRVDIRQNANSGKLISKHEEPLLDYLRKRFEKNELAYEDPTARFNVYALARNRALKETELKLMVKQGIIKEDTASKAIQMLAQSQKEAYDSPDYKHYLKSLEELYDKSTMGDFDGDADSKKEFILNSYFERVGTGEAPRMVYEELLKTYKVDRKGYKGELPDGEDSLPGSYKTPYDIAKALATHEIDEDEYERLILEADKLGIPINTATPVPVSPIKQGPMLEQSAHGNQLKMQPAHSPLYEEPPKVKKGVDTRRINYDPNIA